MKGTYSKRKKVLRLKRIGRYYIALFALIFFAALWIPKLRYLSEAGRLSGNIAESAGFRAQPVNNEIQKVINKMEDPGEYLAVYWLESDFGNTSFFLEPEEITRYRRRWERAGGWSSYFAACQSVWDDLVYFPVARLGNGSGKDQVSFENSWMYERSYQGERGHEGTDIMPERNERGVIPVVSMTDGTVQNMGWLELGGYRIGIRTERGAYFYYAHLDSYADLQTGDKVKAGDLLGFMGDTGYSSVEGTTGKFPVHLHLGIYLPSDDGEVSINPYPALKYVENRRIQYKAH